MKLLRSCIILCILILFSASIPAADESYQGWRQIQTDRVTIIFEPRDLAHAEHIAGFADEVTDQISGVLGYKPKTPIPVVLAGRTAAANGFYSPFPHSITLFVTAPSSRFLGSRSADWLYTLFVHEVTHYIHLTAREGPAKLLAPVFGPEVTAMNPVVMPGWWLEGITTYAETAFAPGGRGEAPLFELSYTAPILEGNMWSLSQGGYQSAYPPSGRIYVGGYIFVDYLVDRFGIAVFRRINAQYLGFPFFGISHAIRQVTGYDADTLYQDMIDSILQGARREDVMRIGNQLSPAEYGDFHLPYPTQEGWFGHARTLDAGSALMRYHGEAAESEKLMSLSVSDSWSLSPSADGRLAAAASIWTDHAHPASVINAPVTYSDLHIIRLADGTSRQITEGKRLYQPALNHDGSKLAAIERDGSRFRLVRVDIDSGSVTPVYSPPEGGSVYQPRFSPRENAAAAVEVQDGRSTLIIVEADGEVRSLWPHADEEIFHPRFTPEGTLLFASDRSGTLRLYETDPETGTTWELLDDPAGVIGADVHDGQLVYGTYTSRGYALFQLPCRDLERKQVSPPEAAEPSELHLNTGFEAYDSQKYRDIPRPGFWFPFFIDQDRIAPGAWAFAQSVLGRHSVQASAGWSIRDDLPLLQAHYTFMPGWGALSFSGSHNALYPSAQNEWKRLDAVSASLTLPLWYQRNLYSAQMVSAALQAEYQFRDSGDRLYLIGQGGYQHIWSAPPAAFYGGSAWSASAGAQTLFHSGSSDAEVIPFAAAEGQIRLPWAHHVLRAEVQGLSANYNFKMKDPLPPRGNPNWGPDLPARAKIQPTLLYRMPLGLFDQPLPFGTGITGAGVSLFAQSAWYRTDSGISWEEELYAGIEGALDISASGLAVLRPAAGVTFDVKEGKIHPYVSLDILSNFMRTGDHTSGFDDMLIQKRPAGSWR